MKKVLTLLIALVMWICSFDSLIAAATPLNSALDFTVFHPDQEKTFVVGEDSFTLKHFTNTLSKSSSQVLSVVDITHSPNSQTGGFLLEKHLVNAPETFYALAGEFEFFGSQSNESIRTKVTAGDIVSIPAGTPYGYKNVGSEPGRILLITASDGFEQFIEEIGIPITDSALRDRTNNPSMDKIAAIAHKYGIDFLN